MDRSIVANEFPYALETLMMGLSGEHTHEIKLLGFLTADPLIEGAHALPTVLLT